MLAIPAPADCDLHQCGQLHVPLGPVEVKNMRMSVAERERYPVFPTPAHRVTRTSETETAAVQTNIRSSAPRELEACRFRYPQSSVIVTKLKFRIRLPPAGGCHSQ